jgi:hypothetical protein
VERLRVWVDAVDGDLIGVLLVVPQPVEERLPVLEMLVVGLADTESVPLCVMLLVPDPDHVGRFEGGTVTAGEGLLVIEVVGDRLRETVQLIVPELDIHTVVVGDVDGVLDIDTVTDVVGHWDGLVVPERD